MRLILLTSLLLGTVSAGAESRQAAVNRAIEQTKSRLSVAQAPARQINKNAAQSPGRSESIDVERLNKLIRALDKTWVLPKSGAKEPVGSNFQYKKTCSSIYKARHGACQQLGFGVMCFNYCHERGEKLSFKCQDASDATYCRQSGTFETFIAKYRKDAYKAKAYVHQMISRCYATAICNTQTGLLNASIIDEEDTVTERTTRLNRLKLLTRRPLAAAAATVAPTEVTTIEEPIELVATTSEEEETTTTTKKPRSSKKTQTSPAEKKKVTLKPKNSKSATTTSEVEATTAKANVWDKFTVGQKAKPTSKYIPFWQRLMSTTIAPGSDEEKSEETTQAPMPEETPEPEPEPESENPEDEDETMEKSEEELTTLPTTTTPEPTTKRSKSKSKTSEKKVIEQKTHKAPAEKTPQAKHTFKPIPVTVPAPQGPELAFQKPIDQNSEQEPGFWNRFQPNRWFQSIHYMTNTGK